jgi:hypothetical protein
MSMSGQARRLLRGLRTRVVERAVVSGTDDLRKQVADLARSVRALQETAAGWAGRQTAEVQALSARVGELGQDIVRVRQQVRYLSLAEMGRELAPDPLDLTPYEMSFFSQNGEDGVLVEVLRRVGSGTRRFVEIGASHAEANCLFLADVLGWQGWFVEAASNEVARLRRRFTGNCNVSIVEAFVDRDNINEVLGSAGATGEMDVFSLDIDGNDYWVWEALEVIHPRIVIVEYNSALDQQRPIAQRYEAASTWDGTDAFGSSREALRELGNRKHYRLVHADIAGVNLVFVREDLCAGRFLPEAEVAARSTAYFLSGYLHPPSDGTRSFVDPTDPGPD